MLYDQNLVYNKHSEPIVVVAVVISIISSNNSCYFSFFKFYCNYEKSHHIIDPFYLIYLPLASPHPIFYYFETLILQYYRNR